jgi:hypothetical protein
MRSLLQAETAVRPQLSELLRYAKSIDVAKLDSTLPQPSGCCKYARRRLSAASRSEGADSFVALG